MVTDMIFRVHEMRIGALAVRLIIGTIFSVRISMKVKR